MLAEIKEIIKNKLGVGTFGINVLTLMSGSTVSQAVPVMIAPILTRLYSSEAFGGLALFQSLLAVFSAFACLRYETAIVLCRDEKEIVNTTALSVISAFILSSILALLIVIWHDPIVHLLHWEMFGTWLYVVPVAVMLIGIYNALVYANLREKNFKVIAKSNVYKACSMAVTTVSLGFFGWEMKGLICGQLVSIITGNRNLALYLIKQKEYFKMVSITEMKRLAKRFIDFPLYSTWGAAMNALTQNLASFLIISIFTQQNLGYYALSIRILGAPLQMIGQSISQVYLQRASEEKRQYGNSERIFNATLKKLVALSLLFGLFLYFFVEDLCVWLLGAEWEIAGIYTRILLPWFVVRFISSSLSATLNVFEKQKQSLVINCLLFIAMIIIFAIVKVQSLSIERFLYLNSGILSLLYLSFIFYYKILSKG